MTYAQAAIFIPSALIVIGYIIRLERKISSMATDISWIKGNLLGCPPLSEKDTS